MPAQLTVRADPDLIERVRLAAQRAGRSMNEQVVFILDAATNPDHAGDEASRLRERLIRAGLAIEVTPKYGARPDPARIAEARRHAGRGTQLSDLVSADRDDLR